LAYFEVLALLLLLLLWRWWWWWSVAYGSTECYTRQLGTLRDVILTFTKTAVLCDAVRCGV
jgi:hypothetical protein